MLFSAKIFVIFAAEKSASFMKKISVLLVLFFTIAVNTYSQELPKNIFGISAGIVPAYSNMFLDRPFTSWPLRETGPVYHFFYARQVRESFRMGAYYEYEQAKFKDPGTGDLFGFDRYNVGIDWLGQIRIAPLQIQLGGYFGFGFLKAQTWDRPFGYDLGLIAGPAWENERIGIAMHILAGHAWYQSSGSPSGVMLYTPKVLLKVYYKLKPGKNKKDIR